MGRISFELQSESKKEIIRNTLQKIMDSTLYNPDETAILVIDIQKPFYSGRDDVPVAFPGLGKKVSEMLQHARLQKYLVIHARQVSLEKYSPWLPTWYRKNGREWSCEIRNNCTEDFAKESKDEFVVEKTCFSAFHKTNLDDILRKNNIKSVLVCGLLTSICVNYTAIGAYMLGFNVGLLTDCCGDLSEDRHSQSLKLNECLFDMISLEQFRKVSRKSEVENK